MATLAATGVETPVKPYDNLLPANKTAQATNHMAVNVLGKLFNKTLADDENNIDIVTVVLSEDRRKSEDR
jgi:hypothetical protein